MALLLRRRGSSGGFRPTLPNFHVCAPPLLHSPDSDSIAELAACLLVTGSPGARLAPASSPYSGDRHLGHSFLPCSSNPATLRGASAWKRWLGAMAG